MIDSNTKFTATILTVSILAACGGGNSGTTSSQNTTTGTTGTTEKSYNSFVKSDSTFEVTGFEVNTDYEDGTTKLIEVNETGVANVQAKQSLSPMSMATFLLSQSARREQTP